VIGGRSNWKRSGIGWLDSTSIATLWWPAAGLWSLALSNGTAWGHENPDPSGIEAVSLPSGAVKGTWTTAQLGLGANSLAVAGSTAYAIGPGQGGDVAVAAVRLGSSVPEWTTTTGGAGAFTIGGAGIAVGAAGIYAVSVQTPNFSVVRLDPGTGRVLARMLVPQVDPKVTAQPLPQVIADGPNVYVYNNQTHSSSGPPDITSRLERLDPPTLQPRAILDAATDTDWQPDAGGQLDGLVDGTCNVQQYWQVEASTLRPTIGPVRLPPTDSFEEGPDGPAFFAGTTAADTTVYLLR